MKKMMKKCWLMLGLLAITVIPSLTSCSDDDDAKKEEIPAPFLKINGGSVNFALDQYEATIASIEANNEVTSSGKLPSWIDQVVVSKNADGTYSALITRNKANDTELRSDSIVFSAGTLTAKVPVSCAGQQLSANYTVTNSTAPAAGFFGEKSFGFSVLRAASTAKDTVLVYVTSMMGYRPADGIVVTPSKTAPLEAISRTDYSVKVGDYKNEYGDGIRSLCFFIMDANRAEDFDPNGPTPAEPAFSVNQYNGALSLIASASEIELASGKSMDVTVVYDNTVASKIKVFVGEGWPDFTADDPIQDMQATDHVTLVQKSSSMDGKYTTVVYTISAVKEGGGEIVLFAMSASDEYAKYDYGDCIAAEILYTINPAQ